MCVELLITWAWQNWRKMQIILGSLYLQSLQCQPSLFKHFHPRFKASITIGKTQIWIYQSCERKEYCWSIKYILTQTRHWEENANFLKKHGLFLRVVWSEHSLRCINRKKMKTKLKVELKEMLRLAKLSLNIQTPFITAFPVNKIANGDLNKFYKKKVPLKLNWE